MKKIFLFSLLFIGLFTLTSCQTDDYEIVSVDDLGEYTLILGSDLESLALPQTVRAELENGLFTEITLNWDDALSLVDPSVSGTYTLNPEPILKDNVSLPDSIDLSVTLEIVNSTVLDYIAASDTHTIFHEALLNAQVSEILTLDGPFTVFAPSDEAFLELFELLETTKEDFLLRDDLSNILNYHILNTRYDRNELILQMPGTINTLTGEALSFSLDGPHITINQVTRVTNSNESLNNGVLHEIDQVLFPPSSVEDTLTDLIDEELLNEILEILSASISIPDLLAGNVEITVFIPSEAALTAFAITQGMDLETFIASEDFPALLTYHMVVGEYYASTLFESAPTTIEALNGETLAIEVNDNILNINNAEIISTEIFEGFGIIHEIDRVLVPPSLEDVYN
ncbi:MAG: fasciclin domain-containing protein [Candidatus Izemoplasmataceae bacterium]